LGARDEIGSLDPPRRRPRRAGRTRGAL